MGEWLWVSRYRWLRRFISDQIMNVAITVKGIFAHITHQLWLHDDEDSSWMISRSKPKSIS